VKRASTLSAGPQPHNHFRKKCTASLGGEGECILPKRGVRAKKGKPRGEAIKRPSRGSMDKPLFFSLGQRGGHFKRGRRHKCFTQLIEEGGNTCHKGKQRAHDKKK